MATMKTIELGSRAYDLEGSLTNAKEAIDRMAKIYGDDYSNLQLVWQREEYEEGYTLMLLGDRPETPEETKTRKEREKELKAMRDIYRRRQFAELKAEFEPKSEKG